MPSTKPASRQANYRSRTQLRAMATLLGWRLMDIAGVFDTGSGTYVIVEHDGSRVELSPVEGASAVSAPATPHRKLTAPKSWNPIKWNTNVKAITEKQLTKADTIAQLHEIAKTSDAPDLPKRLRQAEAVFEACPDTPDWYLSLPMAEVVDDDDH